MSNLIRPVSPVFRSLDNVVFEVAVPADITSFTWVILKDQDDSEPTLWAAGWRPRDLKSDGKASSEQTIRARTQLRPDIAPPADNFNGGVENGDYLLHLYAGRPKGDTRAEAEAFINGNTPLDVDSFSVVQNFSFPGGLNDNPDIGDTLHVTLVRPPAPEHSEQRNTVTFKAFRAFLEDHWSAGQPFDDANSWPAYGPKPYQALRDAARDFVSRAAVTSFNQLIPQGYLNNKLEETRHQFPALTLPAPEGRDAPKVTYLPGVELIWNYWLEEGMLVQTLNVILARFQNRRLPGRDPLGRFDVTPLLPLRNKLWGYAEDEVHRMTIRRRAVEYEYEYGLSLIGRAVPSRERLVERRNGFLETFHQVLFLAHRFFKEYDDLTVQADAFPLYRALRDCHIVLSQGSQNQYGEMAVAARAEFLVMQSILAEPQMREFLGGRPMTPYPEEWMDRVDSMKAIQGWSDTSIMHFNDLAAIGEELVLTIRLGNWADTGVGVTQAANWAAAFRADIQKYAAAYRTATGVDLSREPNPEMPSTLLARKLAGNRIRA